MDMLFNYFVKTASAYKPDAAMRRGSYAQASDRGQYRSATIGHQGLSKRTAAQLRWTHNLPSPAQQRPTAPANPAPAPRTGAPTNPAPAPRTGAQSARPATVAGAPSSKPIPAAAVNPNSNLGWIRGKMLDHVRENATGYEDPLAQAYGALRQYKTDAELQQGLRQGYQAQLDGRLAGTTDYLNNPQYRLFKYFQDATTLDDAGWDRSQWGHKLQQDALSTAWQDDEARQKLGRQ